MGSTDAKLILYTHHRCPWAHRAHIILEELKVPFEEVIIDLDIPRTPEYLKINPRGLVPALSYNGEIIIESAIVANFLADAYPSHLLPPSNTPEGALRRARVALFVDAFISKFNGQLFALYTAEGEAAQADIVDKAVAALVTEVEPLLADASPYFGGSDKLTQAEVLTGSFVIRLKSLSKTDLYPSNLWPSIVEKAPNFTKWAEKVAVHPSVTSIFNEQQVIEGTRARIAKLKAQKAQQ
ncbi:thioredoxin-like protein [Apiosordaria backusii]|uniref:Thioredoxin-like protein n=1 Tax=Apiosordaria backusii TaxID=314023 RepID=A0AA40A0N8_9PEZI|nr:thioredoxin-like protein [Apiosordaria backusii]